MDTPTNEEEEQEQKQPKDSQQQDSQQQDSQQQDSQQQESQQQEEQQQEEQQKEEQQQEEQQQEQQQQQQQPKPTREHESGNDETDKAPNAEAGPVDHVSDCLPWEAPGIPLLCKKIGDEECANSLVISRDADVVDLQPYIGRGEKYGKSRRETWENAFVFPDHLHDNSPAGVERIRRLLRVSCAAGGFRLAQRSMDRNRHNSEIMLKMRCARGFRYDNKKKPSRQCQSQRPQSASLVCPFNFTVHFKNGKWMIPKGLGNRIHKHHGPVDPKDATGGKKMKPERDVEVAISLGRMMRAAGSATRFLEGTDIDEDGTNDIPLPHPPPALPALPKMEGLHDRSVVTELKRVEAPKLSTNGEHATEGKGWLYWFEKFNQGVQPDQEFSSLFRKASKAAQENGAAYATFATGMNRVLEDTCREAGIGSNAQKSAGVLVLANKRTMPTSNSPNKRIRAEEEAQV